MCVKLQTVCEITQCAQNYTYSIGRNPLSWTIFLHSRRGQRGWLISAPNLLEKDTKKLDQKPCFRVKMLVLGGFRVNGATLVSGGIFLPKNLVWFEILAIFGEIILSSHFRSSNTNSIFNQYSNCEYTGLLHVFDA